MSQMPSNEMQLKVLELLEEFEDKLEASPTVPLTGKVLIDRQDFLNILKDIHVLLPDEYQHVRWIKSQKNQIVEEAQGHAQELMARARQEELEIIETARIQENEILSRAQQKAKELVDQHEIVMQARQKAQRIVKDAEEKAEEIRVGSYTYAEDVMKKVDLNLTKILSTVRENIEELDQYK